MKKRSEVRILEKREIRELLRAISEDSELLKDFAVLVEKSIEEDRSLKEKVACVVSEEVARKRRTRGEV
jgi:hypothetical protein